MNGSLVMALGIGFALGLKHATEADHLVAVTTVVSEQRSIWRSGLVGALWGVGHTASLLLAGVLVIILGIAIPDPLAAILEFLVALMIIVLGGVFFILPCAIALSYMFILTRTTAMRTSIFIFTVRTTLTR
jgi:high-affinity nickel permease